MAFVATAPVYAAGTAEWVDNATVKFDGRLHRDTNIDKDWNFFGVEDVDDCPDLIKDLTYNPLDSDKTKSNVASDTKVTYEHKAKDGGSCSTKSTDTDITLTKPENAQFGFKWINKELIVSADERRQFRFDDDEKTYINRTNEDSVCRDVITSGADKNSVSLVIKRGRTTVGLGNEARTDRLRSDYPGYTFVQNIHYDQQTNDGNCIASKPITVKVGALAKANLPAGEGEDGLNSSSGAGGPVQPTCESEGGSLSWILCPLLFFGDAIIRKLDQAIHSLLTVPDSYFEDDRLKAAWSRLRDIAYIILVPVVLVMVIGTALGFEFVSAYTVKRALPRLIAAVMFIALSFEITKFLIVLTNNVGAGVYGLIIGAFTGAEDVSLASVFSPDNSDSLAATPIFLGALGAAAFIGSMGIILSYVFVAILGLAIGFFLLSLRQMLIIALMLLAPLAILAWIFPGNDKLWKLWWGSFSKLLMLFPLVMVLIATGKSFSVLVAETDGSFVSTLLKLVAYVGPYFLIPATFKLAGGVFANVAGMANDRGRGLFDRQKKYRGEKAAQNWAATKTGQRYKGSNRITGRMNRIGMGAGAGLSGGFGLGPRGRLHADEATMVNSDEHMKSQAWRGNMFKDNAMRALTYENETAARAGLIARANRMTDPERRDAALASVDEDIATAKRIGFGRTSQVAAARQLTMNKTGFDDAADAMDTVSRVAGGNNTMESSLKENVKYIGKGVGRHDLGKLRNREAGETVEQWNDRMTLDGAETADAATLARDHGDSVKNIARAATRTLSTGDPDTKTNRTAQAGKIAASLKDAESFATLANTSNIDTAAEAADSQTPLNIPGPYRPSRPGEGEDPTLLRQQSRGRGNFDDQRLPQPPSGDDDH